MTGWTFIDPVAPVPDESCDANRNYLDGFYGQFAPLSLIEESNEGRLIWPLRAAAQTNPSTMLALSAATFALSELPSASLPGAPPPAPPFPPTGPPSAILHGGLSMAGSNRAALAQAFADLSVTGRNAFVAFRNSPPAEPVIAANAQGLLAGVAGVTAGLVAQGAQRAVSRANAVANYLGAVIPDKNERQRLGWMAVSAEDDPPRRPVNISTLGYPQYDLSVPVRAPNGATVNVEARYAVISSSPQSTPQPHIPPGNVILLFIHGDGSRLEEVTPLIDPLLAAGEQRGRSYTILAVDLPSHGFSTMVDPVGPAFAGTPPWENQAPEPPHRPPSYPMLEFLENFIVNFVATLDTQYHIGKPIGPMGGSLGGNMSLRLARRTDSWIRQSIAWSPACVWDSLADDLVKQAGPNHCSTEGHRPEEIGTRAAFFHDVFDAKTDIGPVQLVAPQGDYWYRADWMPCKTNILAAGRLERRELYNRIYRQWHYRMDWEQLLYSYNDPDPGSQRPRYESFRSRLLLAAGSLDNNSPCTQIYSSAMTLGQRLISTGTNGCTFFVEHTGHSIHDERPGLLASQIDAFTHSFTIGTVDHATFEYTTDDDIHLAGKIDGGSTVKLVSNRGSIVIDGKIDGGSKVELSAGGDVVIGVVGADGDKKIDGGSVVSIVSGGSVRLGNKIDNGATMVSIQARTGIDIGDKIDGGAKVKLSTNTGKIHVHGKIDNGSTVVQYWPAGSLVVGGGIHGNAQVVVESPTTFTIGTIDHTTFEHTTDNDIHVTGKIDGGSTVKLISNHGSIVIDGKIDGGSKVELSAAGDVVIGVVGTDGDKKIDGGSVVSIVSGGSVRLGNKIDNGATVVSFRAKTGIDIGDKIDGGAKVRLRTDTGQIHVHGKIDNGSTRVQYWPGGGLVVDGGIHGNAQVVVGDWA
jgi:pimeloyl-ACP methyl ester carboxylesterase